MTDDRVVPEAERLRDLNTDSLRRIPRTRQYICATCGDLRWADATEPDYTHFYTVNGKREFCGLYKPVEGE